MGVHGFRIPVQGDLHLHTSLSDGLLSPEELVREAAARSLGVVSVTDHDTMDGVFPARAEGAKRGVRVIPGVEISARHQGREVHLIAYGLDPGRAPVREFFLAFREARWRRIGRMVEKLVALGVPVTVDAVRAELLDARTLPCRPHLARALARGGHVGSASESFFRWIGDDGPAYAGFDHEVGCAEAIRFIHAERGVAVLAHPASSRAVDLLPELSDAGLDGVECLHPEQGAGDARDLLAFCGGRGLLATGGSDAHDAAGVGRVRVDEAAVAALAARIETRGGLI